MKNVEIMDLTSKERSILIQTLRKKVVETKGDGDYNIHIDNICINAIDDYSVEYTLMYDEQSYTDTFGKELYLVNLERFV